jgi:hypothetical protein
MDITIDDYRLRAALTSERESDRRWGTECAKLLRQRLCELAAAEDLGVAQALPTLRLLREASDTSLRFTVLVPPQHCLVFEPVLLDTADSNPHVDVSRVRAIRIVAFEDRG